MLQRRSEAETIEPADEAAPPEKLPKAQLRIVMGGALLTMALAALDQNIVNTALPRMVGDLGGMAHISWVVTAFMLTSTVTSPLYGKLSDLFGRRRLFFVAVLTFLAGSLLCGMAQSMGQIIGFRALQGLGAGGLLVLAQAAIGDAVSPRERPRYQGLFTGTFALCSVAGPLLGGVITSALSWRWVFYVNLPIGILALVLIAAGLRTPVESRSRRIDYPGTLLLAAGTTTLLLMMAWGGTEFPWLSIESLGMVLAILVLLGLFVLQETRAPEPLIRLRLFRNKVFARGVVVGGMMTFAMLGSTVFLPLYFQLVLGMSPARAGAMLLPQVVGMVLSSVLGGRIVSRLGRNKAFLLAGLGLEAVALAGLAVLAWWAAAPAVFLVPMGLLGLGMGMGMPNLTTAVQNAVGHSELGAATGAMTFLRSLGGSVGVAASGAIMSGSLAETATVLGGRLDMEAITRQGAEALAALTPAQHMLFSDAYRTALTGCFTMSGVVMSLAFLLVLGLPEQVLQGRAPGR
ncbi:DHA2 family efflux MFS transporter permease subunit [Roseomonas sp. E05]|uniref:DHA2 family efflux MFS transporter permease subunit n=1 Tax=Roseomonas sp. E05 TaxID=3046310 RepID=UPI0024BB800B|nr:DHA2 family efflux MFS transporter permease subunit [Roseomonas sp. E05]MDJ0388655.1 DHA2 family efflux MFS transporter permease subunit [Roseomonas sp. E05]